MSTTNPYKATFLPANVIAAELGLTHSWVVQEAKNGRLPCLKMGRSTVFDLDQVREHLRDRAERRASGDEPPRQSQGRLP